LTNKKNVLIRENFYKTAAGEWNQLSIPRDHCGRTCDSLPHPIATHHPTRPGSLIDFGAI